MSRFIKQGADVNARHKLGWTPLLVATVNEHYDIVEILLKSGADPNLGDNFINSSRTAHEQGLHPIEGTILQFWILNQIDLFKKYVNYIFKS